MTTYFIYKICCNDSSCADFYIGSTQNVRQRKSQHKQSCINESYRNFNLLIYTKIREYGGWDNWRMVVIEEMPNTTLIQARIREEHYRVELQATLNSKSAYIGLPTIEYKKQYYETNKDKMNERHKAYYETHKDKMNEQHKAYCEKNKDKMSEYKKAYYEKNKDKMNEQRKSYREKNKDKILEPVVCSCGRTICKTALKRHLTTKIHNNILMKTT